jgi:hypothetical protein
MRLGPILLLLALTAPATPSPDAGWSTRRSGRFTLVYLPRSERLVDTIVPMLEPELQRVAAALRTDPPAAVRVVVAPDTHSFVEAQGGQSEPFVAGMASPERNTIYLRPLTGLEIRHGSMRAVAAHELAHLVVFKKLNGLPGPAWLEEGLAVFLADEPVYSRAEELVAIALTGRAFMFRTLQDGFPSAPDAAATAYAQSGDFVRFLYREYGADVFIRYLDIMGQGVDPDLALQTAFNATLYELQNRWMDTVRRAYGWIPALSGGTTLWFLMALLAIYAYFRKWRMMKAQRRAYYGEAEAAPPFHPGRTLFTPRFRHDLYAEPDEAGALAENDDDPDDPDDLIEGEIESWDPLEEDDDDGDDDDEEDDDPPGRRRLH